MSVYPQCPLCRKRIPVRESFECFCGDAQQEKAVVELQAELAAVKKERDELKSTVSQFELVMGPEEIYFAKELATVKADLEKRVREARAEAVEIVRNLPMPMPEDERGFAEYAADELAAALRAGKEKP